MRKARQRAAETRLIISGSYWKTTGIENSSSGFLRLPEAIQPLEDLP
jgi:hypothetical protein